MTSSVKSSVTSFQVTDLQVSDPLVMGFQVTGFLDDGPPGEGPLGDGFFFISPFCLVFFIEGKTKRKIEGKTKRNDSFLAEDDPGSDMVAVEWRFCWEKFDQVFV